MRRARALLDLWPWAGLIGAGLAWALAHQIGSDAVFDQCRSTGAPVVTIVGLLTLLFAGLSGYASYRRWRRKGATNGRRFIALVGWMFAILLSLAILLPTIAGFLLPKCLT